MDIPIRTYVALDVYASIVYENIHGRDSVWSAEKKLAFANHMQGRDLGCREKILIEDFRWGMEERAIWIVDMLKKEKELLINVAENNTFDTPPAPQGKALSWILK